ncbi:hypothetical protein ERJ75_000985200 [Trypanosoma vivax]|uniref:RRM domain-containing protein n=1 Tax=Trypanosoma vivax (strain Y486) TaxID=1055687 RepID=G0U6Z1_TRYVY|nr:hypothetical protein TRVL_05662 [Trypanosoma vivax]KAH8611780.1 hypothetical protein ERJ75_000985200 [Trypanosoma vivax]CCC51648.1 conserved hypothetical protein [Trypanosoma vivax Y486]
MDPSKRICLKNIPPDCTKREIAEFVRNRTGSQPHSIDLGLDSEGHVRRYAHFSVEGAKAVVASLCGVQWRGAELRPLMAKPHFTYRLAEARRRREREEETARQEQEAYQRRKTELCLSAPSGELRPHKTPKSFYAVRQRYAEVAAAIAKKCRAEHKSRQGPSTAMERARHPRYDEKLQGCDAPQMNQATRAMPSEDFVLSSSSKTAKTKRPPMLVVESPSPGLTKEERKLFGLQARLAALRAKIK